MESMERKTIQVVCLVALLFFGPPVRAGYDWSTNPGDGSTEHPYEISEPNHLIAIGSDPNLLDKCFLLTEDIVFDPNSEPNHVFTRALIAPDMSSEAGWQGWEFTGTFDGNGHQIRNLRIEADSSDYLGLFGAVGPDGRVSDVGLEGAFIRGHSYIGTVVGLNAGVIEECYAKSIICSSGYGVGGFVGGNRLFGEIRFSYSEGLISGKGSVGGFVGKNEYIVDGSYSAAVVRGEDPHSAGAFSGSSDTTWFHSFPTYGCFYDKELSGYETDQLATGLTTSDLTALKSYRPWVCLERRVLDEGTDYPRLHWETTPGALISAHVYWQGDGSGKSPYLVYSADQLNSIGNCDCESNKHFKLVADVDLSGYDGREGRPEFEMIGSRVHVRQGMVSLDAFRGVIDGDGHVIRNLHISDVNPSEINGIGLVARNGGVLRDILLENVCIETPQRDGVAGLVGGNAGTVEHCAVNGRISGRRFVGGLTGINSGRIVNTHAMCTVEGQTTVGGLVGWLEWGGVLSDCYAAGDVCGVNDLGGLVGIGDGDPGTVSSCYFLETAGPDNGYGSALSDEDMRRQESFVGWDFIGEGVNGPNDIWTIDEGEGYPRFVWEVVGAFAGDEVDFGDYCLLAGYWGREDCEGSDDCGGADVDFSGAIDFTDLRALALHWLSGVE
jgi:hypothetical protein